ncbi:MAG: radical SAM protein [Candidatus Heimdallarchaeota archaeon]
MKASLSLTHNCNMACNYCYAGEKKRKDMKFDTGQKIVDFILNITPQDQIIEMNYFGGEPLLHFNLIKEITQYIRTKEHSLKHPVTISITTNGTLLTSEILEYFRKEKINVCISIDGDEKVHNINRCFKSGNGSFKEVVKKLELAVDTLDYVQVNAVYGPETVNYLQETVAFLAERNVSAIHLNPNISADWKEDNFPTISGKFQQIADYYINCFEKGKEIAVNYIDNKIIIFLKGGYDKSDKCAMGEKEWGFAPSGNIYPCERLIGNDEGTTFCLGNIYTGLNLEYQCSLIETRDIVNIECKDCKLQKYCMNWCGCTNYYMTGKTNLTGPFMCANESAAIEAAKRVLVTLKDNELFVNHFYQYLQRKC